MRRPPVAKDAAAWVRRRQIFERRIVRPKGSWFTNNPERASVNHGALSSLKAGVKKSARFGVLLAAPARNRGCAMAAIFSRPVRGSASLRFQTGV